MQSQYNHRLKEILIKQLKSEDLDPFVIAVQKLDLMKMLRSNVLEVVFEKKDGSARYMEGTHVGALMTESSYAERDDKLSSGGYNPNLLRLYDLEKDEWRALRPLAVYMYRKPGQLPIMTMKLKNLWDSDQDAALSLIEESVQKMGQNIKPAPEQVRVKEEESTPFVS